MNITSINSTFNPVDDQVLHTSTVIIICMQVVNFFIGIPLNVYVVVLLTRAGGLDESVFFAVSQSASEILYALSAPLYIQCMVVFCLTTLLKYFSGIGMVARLTFQCLVCLERYLAVVHPITFLKFKPLKYRLFCLIVAWICVLTCSIVFMFASEFNNFGSYNLVIVIVELFCCVSILKVLRQPAPGHRVMQREGKVTSQKSNTKKKAFRIVCISLIIHLIQLVPLVVLFGLRNALSLASTKQATSINMAVNIAAGLIPPCFFLYRNHQKSTCKNN